MIRSPEARHDPKLQGRGHQACVRRGMSKGLPDNDLQGGAPEAQDGGCGARSQRLGHSAKQPPPRAGKGSGRTTCDLDQYSVSRVLCLGKWRRLRRRGHRLSRLDHVGRTRMPRPLPSLHPGEVLREEFMEPFGLSAYCLADVCHIPRTRIERIAREEVGITADTALRLAK